MIDVTACLSSLYTMYIFMASLLLKYIHKVNYRNKAEILSCLSCVKSCNVDVNIGNFGKSHASCINNYVHWLCYTYITIIEHIVNSVHVIYSN